jgi:DNA-binding LacI/PurR family transcriptional regulator
MPIDPAMVVHGEYCSSAGAEAMDHLLEKAPDLDAVFVNSDLNAIAAIEVIRRHGKRTPEDIAVVGYDDLSIASYNQPPLTTIRQNIPLAGKLLAQNLIQYLKTGVVSQVTMPVELVVRRSA